MSSSADSGSESLARSRQLGDRTAAAVYQRVDALEHVPDREAEWYDARPETAVWPSTVPLVGMAVVEAGRPVEIKSCVRDLGDQRGRIYLRRDQHRQLVDAGAVYLFAIVDDRDREPVAAKIFPATVVDDVIPAWRDAGDGRQDCSQISWARFFDPDEVSD